MGKWDALDKRTDLTDYEKKHIKMTKDLYMNALSSIGCFLHYGSISFRRFIEDLKDEYPSVVAFLNDGFWDQIVPETTKNNEAIKKLQDKFLAEGGTPDDLGFPEFEGETLLEVMLSIVGMYFKDRYMSDCVLFGIDISEEQTDPKKQDIANKIKKKVNK